MTVSIPYEIGGVINVDGKDRTIKSIHVYVNKDSRVSNIRLYVEKDRYVTVRKKEREQG